MKKYLLLILLIILVIFSGVIYVCYNLYYINEGLSPSEARGNFAGIVFIFGIISYIIYAIYKKIKK
ncbi:hypothetical protein [Ruminiclostridium papyrosolvens]|uniref:Uncharacterized protein n=1 Tax=Ruminiclostridium papyrosolvens C7 TaxID=1330534 RepID=U4R577_9FIRM|nr:hypothetical protein [Ruminiclostridium papyrosolvens]EPR13761.1 hypothetical protein L323_03220 [Ruminiclostridium papyrosolvens C7]